MSASYAVRRNTFPSRKMNTIFSGLPLFVGATNQSVGGSLLWSSVIDQKNAALVPERLLNFTPIHLMLIPQFCQDGVGDHKIVHASWGDVGAADDTPACIYMPAYQECGVVYTSSQGCTSTFNAYATHKAPHPPLLAASAPPLGLRPALSAGVDGAKSRASIEGSLIRN